MTTGTMKIADKVCNVIFHEGRTYIQPQFSCIIKGSVEKVTEAANGWDILILQEAYWNAARKSSRFWIRSDRWKPKNYREFGKGVMNDEPDKSRISAYSKTAPLRGASLPGEG